MNRDEKITMVIFLAAMIVAAIAGAAVFGTLAEPALTEAWVLCQPDSWVNIRSRPSSKGEKTGYLESGDRIWIDGKTKDGYAHIDRASTEAGEGWVHAGYIVFEEPELIGKRCWIRANGRVAARRTIDGDRRCWLVDGSEVSVIQVAGDWALTDEGFVKTEYIDLEGIR